MKMTANDWQLYSTMKGVNIIATTLTKKLERELMKAKAKIAENHDSMKVAINVRNTMYETMTKVRQFGARDTEPECVLVETIERELNLPYGSLGR